MATTVPPPPSINAQTVRAVLTALVAIAVDLAIYGAARLLDVALVLPEPGGGPPTRLPLGAVIGAAVGGVTLAALALFGLRRFAPDHARVGLVAAIVVFALISLSAPLGADTDTATKVALVCMHLATAVVAGVGLLLPYRSAATTPAPGPSGLS